MPRRNPRKGSEKGGVNSCEVKAKGGGVEIVLSDGERSCQAVFNITAAFALKQDIEKAMFEAMARA